jgi:hypothetical protein
MELLFSIFWQFWERLKEAFTFRPMGNAQLLNLPEGRADTGGVPHAATPQGSSRGGPSVSAELSMPTPFHLSEYEDSNTSLTSNASSVAEEPTPAADLGIALSDQTLKYTRNERVTQSVWSSRQNNSNPMTHIPPTLLGIFQSEVFRFEVCQRLQPRAVSNLAQTCRYLRDICHEQYLLGQVLRNSTLRVLTATQIDPRPELPDSDWQTLDPVIKRVDGEFGRCISNGRLLYQPDLDRPPFLYRFRTFEPKAIEFFLPGNLGRAQTYSWELEKIQGKASRYEFGEWNGSWPPTILCGGVYLRFEDFRFPVDSELHGNIPIYVFYRRRGEYLYLLGVSIPFGWVIDRLSESTPASPRDLQSRQFEI